MDNKENDFVPEQLNNGETEQTDEATEVESEAEAEAETETETDVMADAEPEAETEAITEAEIIAEAEKYVALEADEGSDTASDEHKKDSFSFKFSSMLFDTLEIFVISVIAVLLIFTFCFRLCRVSGDSMNETLKNKEMLITSDLFYEPMQGDIVVFHLSNDHYKEPLVKRVIATEGQTVTVNITTGATYVDGKLLDESYAHFNKYGNYDQSDVPFLFDMSKVTINDEGQEIFTATVPEGCIFVMGDNRNNSSDSRNKYVGFVDEDCILGKALFRVSPFTKLS